MKYVLIRDDDVSCFTEKSYLEKLYEPLLERGIPVNFSVVPQIDSDIQYGRRKPLGIYYKKFRMKGSPAVPPSYRGQSISRPLEQNEEVVKFLLQYPHVEILQHGYDHGFIKNRSEFDIRDISELEKRIQKGKDILSRTFGRTPDFFVAPRDTVSSQALECLSKKFKGISLWRLFSWERSIGNLIRSLTQGKIADCMLPFQTLPLHIKLKKRKSSPHLFIGDFLILAHPGCLLTRFSAPEEIYSSVMEAADSADILTLVNHHWEYFFDWDGLDESFFGAWEKVIDTLIKREDVKFLTFNELYQKLHPNPARI